jgi:hypothetical protein
MSGAADAFYMETETRNMYTKTLNARLHNTGLMVFEIVTEELMVCRRI